MRVEQFSFGERGFAADGDDAAFGADGAGGAVTGSGGAMGAVGACGGMNGCGRRCRRIGWGCAWRPATGGGVRGISRIGMIGAGGPRSSTGSASCGRCSTTTTATARWAMSEAATAQVVRRRLAVSIRSASLCRREP